MSVTSAERINSTADHPQSFLWDWEEAKLSPLLLCLLLISVLYQKSTNHSNKCPV